MAAAKRENFGGRMAVILAMAGSAIGLGNLWRFPYMVGEHGGSVYVFVYILATIFISLPVFVAEVIIGRRSRVNASAAMGKLAPGKSFWKAAGFMPIFIPTLIASYYSVIGGWSVQFFVESAAGQLVNNSPEVVEGIFGSFISGTWAPVLMHLLFLLVTAIVVASGVKTGIEKFSKVALPVLFLLIVIMVVYSVGLPGASAGVRYLSVPDFSQMTPRTLSYAMGQSFFSLSLGMGSIITYGSYVSKSENIVVSSVGTAVSDLAFAMLAAFAIMPAVFAAGIEPGAGPGLIFQSVPFIFNKMGADIPVISTIMAVLFFLTVVVAAMTSCISLVEVGVAYIVERFGISRPKASAILFLICGSAGVLCSLSFGPLAGVTVAGMSIFDLFDWTASNILLLLMAFLAVVFVGFVMSKDDVRDEFTNGGIKKKNAAIFGVFYFLIRWVCPIALVLIFITNFLF